MVAISTNLTNSEFSCQLAKQYNGNIVTVIGIHPHEANEVRGISGVSK